MAFPTTSVSLLTSTRCMPKIYVICLLVVLNSRLSLRRDMSVFQRYRLVRTPLLFPLSCFPGDMTRIG